MVKTIKINYKGNDYTLEFTRRSIETMEKGGFVISDVENKPMSTLPALFAGAFLANHRFIKKELIDEIYEAIPDKSGFIGKLVEMYVEPLETLFDEPKESEGNASWGASW